MAVVLKTWEFSGEAWDTPPKYPEFLHIHKLIVAAGEIGEPAIHKLVQYIEEHPEELVARNYTESSPLIWATVSSTPEIVQILIDYGAELDWQSFFVKTALMWAAVYSKVANCKVLIDAGADLTIKDVDGHDAFFWAKNNPEITALLNDAANNPIRMKALEWRNNPEQEEEPDYMTVDI